MSPTHVSSNGEFIELCRFKASYDDGYPIRFLLPSYHPTNLSLSLSFSLPSLASDYGGIKRVTCDYLVPLGSEAVETKKSPTVDAICHHQ